MNNKQHRGGSPHTPASGVACVLVYEKDGYRSPIAVCQNPKEAMRLLTKEIGGELINNQVYRVQDGIFEHMGTFHQYAVRVFD